MFSCRWGAVCLEVMMCSQHFATMHLTSLGLANSCVVGEPLVVVVSLAVYKLWLGYILSGWHFLKNLDGLGDFLKALISSTLFLMMEWTCCLRALLRSLEARLRVLRHASWTKAAWSPNSSSDK